MSKDRTNRVEGLARASALVTLLVLSISLTAAHTASALVRTNPFAPLARADAALTPSRLSTGPGEYDVYVCENAYASGAATQGGTSSQAAGQEFSESDSACGDPLISFEDHNVTQGASGDSSGFFVQAPSGPTGQTYLSAATVTDALFSSSGGSGWTSGLLAVGNGGTNGGVANAAGCESPSPNDCNVGPAPVGPISFAPDTEVFGPSLACDQATCAGGPQGGFQVGGMDVVVSESAAPTWMGGINSDAITAQSNAKGWFSDANAPPGGWGLQPRAGDTSGLCAFDVSLVSTTTGKLAWDQSDGTAPDEGSTTPCVTPEHASIETLQASIYPCQVQQGDGQYSLVVGATNAAGRSSSPPGGLVPFNIDCTAPAFSFTNGPSQSQWYNTAQSVQLVATDASSGVSRIACTLNGAPLPNHNSGDVVTVQPPGGQLSCTPYDNAGNAGVTQSYQLNLDTTAPTGQFQPQNPQNPTQVQVSVADGQSGVAGGIVQVEQADGSWIDALTTINAAHDLLTATLPDDRAIADGPHAIRALISDAAGNDATITTNATGGPEQVSWPLRTVDHVTVGTKEKLHRVCRSKSTPKPHEHAPVALAFTRGTRPATSEEIADLRRVAARLRPIVHPGGRPGTEATHLQKHCSTVAVPVKRAKLHLGHNQRGRFKGRLVSSDGQPIPNATILVADTPVGYATKAAGHVTTDAKGRFSFTVSKGGPERTLLFSYAGSGTVRPANTSVEVVVRGAGTIHAAEQTVAPNAKETITGRVEGGYIPPGGKIVQLFDRAHGFDWQPFEHAVHTDSDGRWRLVFPVSSNAAHRRFEVRAVLVAQAGWPWPKTTTSPVTIRVR